jgi:hypothetical protein
VLNQTKPVAFVTEPQLEASRPRTKPSAADLAPVTETVVEEVAEVEKPKPVRRKKERVEPTVAKAPELDVYKPPAREADIASSTMPDMLAAAPVHAPGDIPAAPMPSSPAPVATYVPSTAPSEPSAPATSGPAPLYPIAQP